MYLVTFHFSDPDTFEIEKTDVVLVGADDADAAAALAEQAIGPAEAGARIRSTGRVYPLAASDRLRLGLPFAYQARATLIHNPAPVLSWLASAA